MFIYIENCKYKIKSYETIKDLKAKFLSKTGIFPRLTRNGEELKNNHTLSYYNINKRSILTLISDFEIFVTTTTGKPKIITLKVNGSCTIKALKATIADKRGILHDHEQLWLYYAGRKLADELSLDDCGILIGSELSMVVIKGSGRGM